MSTVISGGVTDVGRVRDHNEDSYFVGPEQNVFIVADGMGGHAAGEVASKLAVDGVAKSWCSSWMQSLVRDYAEHGDIERRKNLLSHLRAEVFKAHQEILDLAERDESKKGMGTTLIGFLVAGGEALFAHAGDSRAYLIRDRIPVLLSEDHTISSRLRAVGIDRGMDVDGAPAGHDRWKGVLTNALGLEEGTRVTTFVVPLFSGDRIVLCSDGVHDYLSEDDVASIVMGGASPALAAHALVKTALERGGADNATCIVVKVMEAGTTKIPKEVRDEHERVLASCPLFEGLSPQQLLQALRITTPRLYKEGKDVPRVALEDRVAYIVLEGRVAGSGTIANPGDMLLPEALLQHSQSSEEDLVTCADTHLLMIRHKDFTELCEDDPELGVIFYETVARLVSR